LHPRSGEATIARARPRRRADQRGPGCRVGGSEELAGSAAPDRYADRRGDRRRAGDRQPHPASAGVQPYGRTRADLAAALLRAWTRGDADRSFAAEAAENARPQANNGQASRVDVLDHTDQLV